MSYVAVNREDENSLAEPVRFLWIILKFMKIISISLDN